MLEGRIQFKRKARGTSLAVQWLGLCASTAGGTGSIPGQGTKKKKKEKESSSLQEGDGVRKVLKCKEGLGDRAGLRWKVL